MEIVNNTINATQPDAIIAWQSIDWHHAKCQVRKIQERIVKAVQNNQWRIVRSLQRLLTRSLSAKQLAVKQVTENRGKSTPGVDGELWSTPKIKTEQIYKLKWTGYKAKPLKRIYIPKTDGRLRPLGIPTMHDRTMQALQKLALEPISETLGDQHSYGFRPMRCAADAIEYSHNLLSRKTSAQWIIDADISSCFDRINHEWLIKNIPMNKRILTQWLKAGYIEKGTKHSTELGTPQGGIISPILANMTLDGLEILIRKSFKRSIAWKENEKVNIVRYADDFLITGKSKEILDNKVMPLIKDFLAERGLELSKEKTRIRHISEGVDFLGFTIRKYPCGKVLSKPSLKSQKNFRHDIKTELAKLKAAPQSEVVAKIQPKINGWMHYFKHCTAKQVFSKIDHWIWQKLWCWSKRRHPNKGSKWVKTKYFHRYQGQDWRFGYWDIKRDNPIFRNLPRMSNIPIKRHSLIKGEFNHYDSKWKDYAENRSVKLMKNAMTDMVYKIWIKQAGKCQYCTHEINDTTKWHLHHKLPRHKGGSMAIDNLVLLHPECHRQLHSRNTAGLPVQGNLIYA